MLSQSLEYHLETWRFHSLCIETWLFHVPKRGKPVARHVHCEASLCVRPMHRRNFGTDSGTLHNRRYLLLCED